MKACHKLMGVLTTALWLVALPATASDTIETWDEGAVDFELYTGAEGMGLGHSERSIFADTTLGYGIVNRLSGYLRGTGEASEQLAEGTGEAGVGLFGTAIDSDHFDLDLILDFGFGADGPAITPAVEINVDAEPDLAFWGGYLRAEESFAGRVEPASAPAPGAPEAEPDQVLAPVTTATLGWYWTAGADHQLLLEADGSVYHHPAQDEAPVDFGGFAAGYNVAVHESIELINQVFFDVPVRDADPFSVGVSIGFIATIMPTGLPSRDPTAPMASGRSKRLSSFRPGR